MRCADETAGAALRELDQFRGLRQRHRHRFFDEHVFAGLECLPRDLAMLLHRSEHEDELDFGIGQNLAVVGVKVSRP